jgi:hypothetical protein
MMKFRGQRRFSMRRIIACAALCMFVLQGVFIASAPLLAIASHDFHMESVVPIADEYCSPIFDGDEGVPHDRTHRHSDCCILCKEAGRVGALSFVVALFSGLVFAEPQLNDSAVTIPVDEIDRRGLGWGSSWSPRAPPSFS